MKYLLFLLAAADFQDKPARKLPNRTRCRQLVAIRPWARGLKQIPSTVIDKGVLRHVPYTSYRAGDYELNVYGDPSAPCCFEIGVYGGLVGSAEAKKNCMDVVKAILTEAEDRKLLDSLKLDEDKLVREGITFEVTPPTAEDAYGGWWISIYDEAALERSRATPKELEKITTTRRAVAQSDAEAKPKGPFTPDPVTEGRWGGDDLKDARKVKDSPEEQQAVYKPAYTRKDGAYVPDRTIDDTGYIFFICANSDKHEDREEILKTCPGCKKESTFFWDGERGCFLCFQCGAAYENGQVKCTVCGKAPKRVRTKHR
jgi:hypothetical protein